MKEFNEHELIKKLEREGFTDIKVCPLPPNTDTGEHTHDKHTVHIILKGKLKIIDKSSIKEFLPGDRVEFPKGTTHKAIGSKKGSMIIGMKRNESKLNSI